jgi:hypothetical protein
MTRQPSTVLTDTMSMDDWLWVFANQILPKVVQFEDCWIFTGPTKNGVHGCVKVGGRSGKVLYTHRIACEAFKQLLIPGDIVMHQCNTPRCCNPLHLKVGDQSENMKYAYQTGAAGRQVFTGGISGIRGVVRENVKGYEYWVAKSDARSVLSRGKDFWDAVCTRKSWEAKRKAA